MSDQPITGVGDNADEDTTRYIDETTPLIKLSTLEYPKYYRDLRNDNRNSIYTYNKMKSDSLGAFGYAEVYLVDKPEVGDVIEEVTPKLADDGKYYQTWQTRDYTPEEIAENLDKAIQRTTDSADVIFNNDMNSGLSVVVSDTLYTFQFTADDRLGWVSQLHLLKDMASDAIVEIRDKKNHITTTAEIATKAYNDMLDGYNKTLYNYFDFLDATKIVTTINDIPEIPESFIVNTSDQPPDVAVFSSGT